MTLAKTPNVQLPTPKAEALNQLGEIRRDFHPQTLWEFGSWFFWELFVPYRGGIALNVASMFSSTASVERTPASR